jgi:GT2 family glycosyltransferase
VVVRTKDRPALLAEAIASIRATRYPCEIVVVNDGGARPEAEGVTLVEHEHSRGRSEAANAGVRAAKNAFVAFLDDDDLFYEEHLSTLANAARGSSHVAWYTDAVSAFLRPGESGAYETRSRMRIYAQDFDRELLLLDNYIPLPTLLLGRDTFLDLGGFDTAFDLFEDWDFLIRLAQRGTFLHVPTVTCEIRHFEGGSSVVLAAPEGSERFRKAKLQVWQKHAAHMSPDVIANVFEQQKRRANALYSDAVELRGQGAAAQQSIAAVTRENVAAQNLVNGYMLRVREIEGALTALHAVLARLEQENVQQRAENFAQRTEIERLTRDLAGAHVAGHGASEEIARLRVEIDRLNGLLEMIYRSRTWKLHTTLEKMRGRG